MSVATTEAVRLTISNLLHVTGFAMDSRLVEDLGADSLHMVEIAVSLEDAFSIQISDAEAENGKTPQDWVILIDSKVDAHG